MRVFIGSSSEQEESIEFLTGFIREKYAGKLEPVPWTVPWTGGQFTLEALLQMVDETDASILFWTPDDMAKYRGKTRHQPRDNLVFEAGLFIAAHGRERTQLMIPSYPSNKEPRMDVRYPTDASGLIWNKYQWADGDIRATGLPATARTVCNRLAKMTPRPRTPTALSNFIGHKKVNKVTTFVGDWQTMSAEGICQLASNPSARSIDLLAAYRAGDIRRCLGEFKRRDKAHLRACFANMWDDELIRAYQRKYYNRPTDHIRNALEESITFLLGPCKVKVKSASDIRVTGVTERKARYEIRLTSQRITYGYYRIDDVAFVVPLDMKKDQDPTPLAWAFERETAEGAFDFY